MGFSIAEGTAIPRWALVDYGSGGAATVYEGSIITAGAGGTPATQGVIAIGAASGAADTTHKYIPKGVVLSGNDFTPTYDSTYHGQKIVSVGTQATLLARDWRFVEGKFPKGEPATMVKYADVLPSTVIRGSIYNSTFGTAPTVVTVTTGSTTGLGMTTTAACFTPVAYNSTYYCRTGANKGLMRMGYHTSTTVCTFYNPFPYDIAIGDTFVAVNVGFDGTKRVQFDSTGSFIDTSAALTIDYYLVDIVNINLEEAGNEYIDFRFNADHFSANRA